MNRIILIGNGFDLAHGLETSYSHFIDYFWNKKIENVRNNYHGEYTDDDIYIDFRHYGHLPSIIKNYKDLTTTLNVKFKFKNTFLSEICKEITIKKWVDIEEHYFKSLLKTLDTPEKVIKLNEEFNSIKLELENYLEYHVNQKKIEANKSVDFNRNICYHIFNIIMLKEINRNGKTNLTETFLSNLNSTVSKLNSEISDNLKGVLFSRFKQYLKFENDVYSINDVIVNLNIYTENIVDPGEYMQLKPQTILFLNFNYTDTYLKYKNNIGISEFERNGALREVINIHGELNNSNNPIIFGYGDEISVDYKTIENLNDNQYLENVKSIKYLETDNYKKLLECIEADLYQVYIMGHSCGNSDRTLLNTVFEHDNCVSIKVYYHKESVEKDNYSDVVRNISRNFTDKKKMRDRVVNKMYCGPLIDS